MTAPSPLPTREFIAGRDVDRLDQFLTLRQPGLSRSRLHSLIVEGMVSLNGGQARPSQRVRAGDRVTLTIPPVKSPRLEAQSLPLSVIYQDTELIVVDKPAGQSVHPGPGHHNGTLVNALLAHCPDIQGVGGVARPGIVHRLDMDTSGLMVVAKTERAHQDLSLQFKERVVGKSYLGLTVGALEPPQGIIDAPVARDPRHRKRMAVTIGGRTARTSYQTLDRLGSYNLLTLKPETGRTHQIRVHLAYLGQPLLGDGLYGQRSPLLSRHFLHAQGLTFRHPLSGQVMDFQSPLPPELKRVIADLKSQG